ncbi:MAG: sigma-70 family RNA polymerase sigma factor [Leptolyngbyaceae cyanobacterium MO_188.B28]|nr:sigma-70 family RNA polymerase sigma factor [Leptolyngbyaceae cyanobacterium MO_188.B28]
MRPRKGLIEKFSTFVQFDADQFQTWVIDPKLRRSMQSCIAQSQHTEQSETFWVLYWYKLWQANPKSLARNHLAAYVQEVCFWNAQRTTGSFTMTQYNLADCFQMAIARLDRILKGFNPDQGYSFKNYASAAFGSLIRESLRQQHEIGICTDWALLRKSSQKRLVEALQKIGLSRDAIHSYVLAWQCFIILYTPQQPTKTRKLPKPDQKTWEAIAQLYNRQRQTQLIVYTPPVSPETLEKWLAICARAVRSYLYPIIVSINTAKGGKETGDFLDHLSSPIHTSLLSQMIEAEEAQTRRTQQAQLSAALIATLDQLKPESQEILRLYYQQKLTQQKIAAYLNLKQCTVSRRLRKARETLLRTLAIWSQTTLNISLTAEALNYTSMTLGEWLEIYYSQTPQPTLEEKMLVENSPQ